MSEKPIEVLAVVEHSGNPYVYGLQIREDGRHQIVLRLAESPDSWEPLHGSIGSREALIHRMAGESFRWHEKFVINHPELLTAVALILRQQQETEQERSAKRATDDATFKAYQSAILNLEADGRKAKFKRQNIQITHIDGDSHVVTALVLMGPSGPALAIDPRIVKNKKYYTITHVPTGYSVLKNIISLARARGIAVRLQTMADWSTLDLRASDIYKLAVIAMHKYTK